MNLCVGLSGVIVGGNPIMVLQADSAVAVAGFQCGLVVHEFRLQSGFVVDNGHLRQLRQDKRGKNYPHSVL